MSWGPDHQQPPSSIGRSMKLWAIAILLFLATGTPLVFHLLIVVAVVAVGWRIARRRRWPIRLSGGGEVLPAIDSLREVQDEAARHRAGLYLGRDTDGGWRFSRSERAVLLVGPPRSGKTSAVIVPALISHPGPVVSTSTKPDILSATSAVRSHVGPLWVFNPSGGGEPGSGVRELHWSPLACSGDWDGALHMAKAMVDGAGVGHGTTGQTHWSRRAQAVLAPMLHAAALDDRSMADVLDWVSSHNIDQAGAILEQHPDASRLALLGLAGVANTEDRERASILSATADAIDVYTSQAALDASENPNFDAAEFVRDGGSLYIYAPAERQHLVAPLVCGLLSEIRRATYRAHAQRLLPHPVLFALDEVANIAPLGELPAIASEGGGQGLLLLAALQDLSQARLRWGAAAEGFLTLFGAKVILPGVADQKTIENISVMLGEYDRRVVSQNRSTSRGGPQRGVTTSTQRTRVLSAGEVANVPAGHALYMDGVAWELLEVTPAHRCEPWRTLTSGVRS